MKRFTERGNLHYNTQNRQAYSMRFCCDTLAMKGKFKIKLDADLHWIEKFHKYLIYIK
jgi:hypothetical protein